MNQKPCDCCKGTDKITPQSVVNRPGLSNLYYRVGIHGTFFETMKARLSNLVLEVDNLERGGTGKALIRPLENLTTRELDDPAIAFLDAWATVADVLTFYQERIVNEGFLNTYSEIRSAIELAYLIGYKPRPGVAASVPLSFEIQAGYEVELPVGTQAKSVPGPEELPQTFETSEQLLARAEWNVLRPRLTSPQYIPFWQAPTIEKLYVAGQVTTIKPNQVIALDYGAEGAAYNTEHVVRFVQDTTIVPAAAPHEKDHTIVTLVTPRVEVLSQAQMLAASVDNQTEETPDTAFLTALAQIIARFTNLEAFNVEGTKMSERVIEIFQQMRLDLPRVVDAYDVLKYVTEKVLPALEAEHQVAEDRGYTKLEWWLSAMLDELHGLVTSRLAEAIWLAGKTPTQSPASSSTFAGIAALKNTLITDIATKPQNRYRLSRSNASIYNTKSDALPQLITAFNPSIKRALYTAWGNAQMTDASPVKRMDVFKRTAHIFGANAPLKMKQIITGAGTPTQTVTTEPDGDWTLAEYETTTRISVDFRQVDGQALIKTTTSGGGEFPTTTWSLYNPIDVTVTIDQGGEPWQKTYRVGATSSDTTDYLGNTSVRVVRSITGGELISDTIHVYVMNQEFELTHDDNSLHLTVFRDTRAFDLNGTNTFERIASGNFTGWMIVPTSRASANVTLDNIKWQPVAGEAPRRMVLDGEYPTLVAGSRIVIDDNVGFLPRVCTVERAETIHVSRYNITAKVTQLVLDCDWWRTWWRYLNNIRPITVYFDTEKINPGEEPITDTVGNAGSKQDDSATHIELDALYSSLEAGRWVIFEGERADVKDARGNTVRGVNAVELVMISDIIQDVQPLDKSRYPLPESWEQDYYRYGDGEYDYDDDFVPPQLPDKLPQDKVHTTLLLAGEGLTYEYIRDTVKIYGNVVMATQGETRQELLGSGKSSIANQRFTLANAPLTYVSAPTPSGIESSLTVRVNEVRWHEVGTLLEMQPEDKEFIVSLNEEGKATITFGDGQHGARIPTGLNNVTAKYRYGMGKNGNVKAEQISQLGTAPLGVSKVRNPIAATGGANRETLEDIRYNAPRGALAMGRLVSLSDYENFARTFAGVGKASAVLLSDGMKDLVHVTIAGSEDIPLDSSSMVYNNLIRAMRLYGDPQYPLHLSVREKLLVLLNARVRILPDYLWEFVEPKIRSALLKTYGFSSRQLGQFLYASHIINTIQRVPGVEYVDLDLFTAIPESISIEQLEEYAKEISERTQETLGTPQSEIRVYQASYDRSNRRFRPAQIAYLSAEVPATLVLQEISDER